MPENKIEVCKSCQGDLKSGLSTRKLVMLPVKTAGNNVNKVTYSIPVCTYCDGPAYERSLAKANRDKDGK